MNYLAHAYLSFSDPEVLVGNMISDFVKGRKKDDYPDKIKKGIMLHRAIDNFTDTHDATRAAKQFFRASYGLYAGAFIDVVYDHFLAKDAVLFPGDRLLDFTTEVYDALGRYTNMFPEKFGKMFPYMEKQNWLYNYRYSQGIQNSFRGLVYRASYLTESDNAFRIFENHYYKLQDCYTAFFPHVKQFAWQIFTGTSQNL